jgi:hypothetical protein
MWLKTLTPKLWKTCMKLESPKMDIVTIEDPGRPRNVVFDHMRKLSITGTSVLKDPYLLDLILQSPMLESLEQAINDLRARALI